MSTSGGVIRDHHFGEGRYEQSEETIQRLLGVDREPVVVEGLGIEAPADWDRLNTPETYLGRGRTRGFASPGGAAIGGRLYQLVRERHTVRERTLEITFGTAGAEGYAFTFG